jgi:hypothetical protein
VMDGVIPSTVLGALELAYIPDNAHPS